MNATTPARGSAGRTAPEPPMTLIEIAPTVGTSDAIGESTLRQLPLLGITGIREVRVSKLYSITGKYNASSITKISRELLTDPITQEYRLEKSSSSAAFIMGSHHRVEIWLKESVSDPVGESTQRAIISLNLAEPIRVRTGRAFHFIGRLTKAQVDKIVDKLLSNPVIHSTKVTQQ